MKITYRGRYTPSELQEAFNAFLLEMSEHGVDEFQFVRIELDAFVRKRPLVLVDQDTAGLIGHLMYDGPHRAVFKNLNEKLTVFWEHYEDENTPWEALKGYRRAVRADGD